MTRWIKLSLLVALLAIVTGCIPTQRELRMERDLEEMKRQKTNFVQGAVENKIPKKIAEEIFVVIDKFANYGFNKSHAVAYSFVAYETAYLKANYPAEFLAANLTNEFGNPDKVTLLLDDCRKQKIYV